jgi:hypothetical protein
MRLKDFVMLSSWWDILLFYVFPSEMFRGRTLLDEFYTVDVSPDMIRLDYFYNFKQKFS